MNRPRRRFVLLIAIGLALLLIPAAAAASPVAWHTYRIASSPNLAAVRCPSSSVCVAITRTGQVLTTENASAATPTWKATTGLTVMRPEEDSEQRTAFNLACPSTHLCVTSNQSKIITTTDPTGPASAWHAVDIQPAALASDYEGRIDSLTCPSATLCVAGINEWFNGEGGGTSLQIATSTNPAGGAAAWTVVAGPPRIDYLTQLACSPGGLCAGGDEDQEVLGSTHPTGGTGAWTTFAQLSAPMVYVACPGVGLCAGADFQGRLVTTTSPASTRWHQTRLASGRYVTTTGCSSTRFCAATGGDQHHATGVLTSTKPATASSWKLRTFSAGGSRLNSVTCRSSTFCVAVGDKGLVAVLRRGPVTGLG